MEASPKPVHKYGKKNIYCPHYSVCLDYAARRRWEYWDCRQCPYKGTIEPIAPSSGTGSDSVHYYEFSPDIDTEFRNRIK